MCFADIKTYFEGKLKIPIFFQDFENFHFSFTDQEGVKKLRFKKLDRNKGLGKFNTLKKFKEIS